MKIKYYSIAIGISVLILFISIHQTSNISLNTIKGLFAGVFFVDSSITKEKLLQDFTNSKIGNEKIRILIVPGHDDGTGGTEFRGIYERDLNIKIAEVLTQKLRQEKRFEVFLTRNSQEYNKEIQTYLEKGGVSIKEFRKKHKNTMDALIKSGLIDTRNKVEHNTAPKQVALRLYGINKWANENNIDIILHLHFNDYPGRKYNNRGKYSGITIYIPERQFSNYKTSTALAKKVFNRLTTYFASSNMPQEQTGIVEDQELIATGSYNTLDPAVLLIEYGYMYESQFTNKDVRTLAINELAFQTYLGILDFFNTTDKQEITSIYNSTTLPYLWNNNLKKDERGDADVFAMQTALALQFLYPPAVKNKNDCPINGNFGPCTMRAVIDFQKKYKINPASGFVGPFTRSKLNELYSSQQ